MKRIAVVILLLFISELSYSQASFFDKTFGYNGVVTTEVSEEGYGGKCILLPDGKILQVASIGTAYSRDAAIYRREHDGKIDSSFGTDGSTMFLTDKHILDPQLVIYPDGRILFIGVDFYGSPGYKTFIYRMLPSGVIDSTFGVNGKHSISDSTLSQILYLTITSDEKIFAAGEEGRYMQEDPMRNPVLWRLTPNGKPDPTFGINGKIVIPLGRDSMVVLNSCRDSNNRFVFFYRGLFEGTNEIFALRAYEDGSIDTTFGSDGHVDLVLTDTRCEIPMAMTLPDGSLVFAMNLVTNNKSRTVLVKFTENGKLDLTFGNGGTMEIALGLDITDIASLALDSSGRIVACGRMSTYFGTATSSVFRILLNGVIDSSFGLNGTLQLVEDYSGFASEVIIQPDGKYLISGGSHSNESGKERIMMARLNPEPTSSVMSGNSSASSPLKLHPTPSTDNCTVTYTLPTSSNCTLTLRDESGREVRVFGRDEYRSIGEHKEEFDLRGLASGVYFLQIESGGSVQTAKLIKQ